MENISNENSITVHVNLFSIIRSKNYIEMLYIHKQDKNKFQPLSSFYLWTSMHLKIITFNPKNMAKSIKSDEIWAGDMNLVNSTLTLTPTLTLALIHHLNIFLKSLLSRWSLEKSIWLSFKLGVFLFF